MSTYYYLACYKCKQRCDGAAKTAGGVVPLGNHHALWKFIWDHRMCPGSVHIVSEHNDRSMRYDDSPYSFPDPADELRDQLVKAKAELRSARNNR